MALKWPRNYSKLSATSYSGALKKALAIFSGSDDIIKILKVIVVMMLNQALSGSLQILTQNKYALENI